MASGLRAKLNALKKETPASRPQPQMQLIVREAEFPLDERLMALPEQAMERMDRYVFNA